MSEEMSFKRQLEIIAQIQGWSVDNIWESIGECNANPGELCIEELKLTHCKQCQFHCLYELSKFSDTITIPPTKNRAFYAKDS